MAKEALGRYKVVFTGFENHKHDKEWSHIITICIWCCLTAISSGRASIEEWYLFEESGAMLSLKRFDKCKDLC